MKKFNFTKFTSTILTSVLTFNIGTSCLNFSVVAEETTNDQEVPEIESAIQEHTPYAIFAGVGNNKENGNGVSMKDSDEDELPDEYEILLGTNKDEKDTDKDGLTDFDEVYKTKTNPLKFDSIEDGKSDGDVDLDEDGLTNLEEINNDINPRKADTDSDGLSDKDEIETYKTNPLVADTDNDKLSDGDDVSLGFNPLNPDTDGNGVLDGDEKVRQTFIKDTSDKDDLVSGIEVTLNATGNVNKTTKVEDIKDVDIMCTDVVGLVGNPYEITTKSQFDNAIITFKVDKEKLGDTKFENLIFLGYDEENDNFVELDTILDEDNETVSLETTHFSKYMLVDSKVWFENWKKIGATYEAMCEDSLESKGENDSDDIRTVSDVSVDASEVTSNEEKEQGIVMNTVSLCVLNDIRLQHSSEVIDGENFEVVDTENLNELFDNQFREMKLSEFENLPDSDKDGLADEIEKTGMILSNGRTVKTNPENADTDDDGLKDGEEVKVVPRTKMMEDDEINNSDFSDDTIVYISFKSISDPTLNDTDYDGIGDKDDLQKNDNRFKADWYQKKSGNWFQFNNHEIEFSVDYRKLFEANTTYDSSLAMFSSLLAADVYSGCRIETTNGAVGSDSNSPENLQSVMGMEDIEDYDIDGADYEDDDKDDNTEVVIGHKTIDYMDEPQEVVLISVRGTNSSNAEWSSNFDVGADTADYYDKVGSNHPYWKNKTNHKGFDVAKNRAIEKINDYLLNHEISQGYVLITGHSRGAAIANLLGKDFEDNKEFISATYTFATPNTTTETEDQLKSYNSIFNIINEDDIIPMLPLETWGFGKYGYIITKSVEEEYESTLLNEEDEWSWEWLVHKINGDGDGYAAVNDYNSNGVISNTKKALEDVAASREELYVIDSSSQGKATEIHVLLGTKEETEEKKEKLLKELKEEKLDKFCNVSTSSGWLEYCVDVNYCPAYLMQQFANLTTGVGPHPTFKNEFPFVEDIRVGRNVTGKYAVAKATFVVSSGKIPVLGGVEDPHHPITYYLLAHNIELV